jgi:hypothetical protein
MKSFITKGSIFIILGIVFFSSLSSANDEIDQIRKAIQKKGAKWIAGETGLSKLSSEERKILCGTILTKERINDRLFLQIPIVDDLPSELDWRKNNGNWVTPVKNQANCGSCWDFSAVGQVESWWKIVNDESDSVLDLSEQFVLSCSEGSCDGWQVEYALDFIQITGVPSEECFIYEVDDEIPCEDACDDWTANAVTIPGWGYITLEEDVITTIKNALFRHPVSASFTVYNDFYSYRSGVYEHVWGGESGGHAILIIGWNDADSCWICKNSWGTNWGETADFMPFAWGLGNGGYFRIKWSSCGMGEYMPFIWDNVTGNAAVDVSVDTLELSLTVGDSVCEQITIANLGTDPLEYFVVDYEIPVMFHVDSFNAWDGSSWWCGDPQIGGYENHWLQFLDIPSLDLSGTQNPRLSWKGFWEIEGTAGTDPPWDGWDGCNVMISTDGGNTFNVAVPTTPPYNCQCLWSFGHPDQGWDMGEGVAGWGGSSNGWVSVELNLTAFKSAQTVIRFAFASDMGFCTLDDESVFGFFADDIRVSDGASILFEDDGENMEFMHADGRGVKVSTWIEVNDGSGILPAGSTTDFEVVIRTIGMNQGTHFGRLQINTNDSTQSALSIPIIMNLQSSTDVLNNDQQDLNPREYILFQNYPNPFNSATRIRFELPEQSLITLTVVNQYGQEVKTLINEVRTAGSYTIDWDGKDWKNEPVSSGIYFIRMKHFNNQQCKKIVLLK